MNAYEAAVVTATEKYLAVLWDIEVEGLPSGDRSIYDFAAEVFRNTKSDPEFGGVSRKLFDALVSRLGRDLIDRNISHSSHKKAAMLATERLISDLQYIFTDCLPGDRIYEVAIETLLAAAKGRSDLSGVPEKQLCNEEGDVWPKDLGIMTGASLKSRYQLIEEVQWGATSVNFVAKDTGTNRSVFLKCVRKAPANHYGTPEGQVRTAGCVEIAYLTQMMAPNNVGGSYSPTAVDLSINEARCLSALPEGAWPRCLNAFSHQGLGFIVQDYLPGISLDKAVELNGVMSLEHAISVLKQCLASIEAVHSSGWLHGDIKPANILIDNGVTRLIDFGAAVPLDDLRRGYRMGTPEYAAPEALERLDLFYGVPADIFSMFSVFLFCLLGRGEYVKISKSSRSDLYNKLEQVMPPAIVSVVAAGLEAAPTDRHQSAAAALCELSSL